MNSLFCSKAVVFLLIVSSPAAIAASPSIGEAKKIVPAALSEGQNGQITLAAGSSLFQNDVVKTGNLGRAGLQFLDLTELEVGPNSSAKLDKFVFNPDRTASEVSLNLAKGVFRFVSGGQSRPNTYTITTPHSTLGIRGTVIEFHVRDTVTEIIVREGTVQACSTRGGSCRELSPQLPANAGVFTSTGFVRTFALGPNNSIGNTRFGSMENLRSARSTLAGTSNNAGGSGGIFPSDEGSVPRISVSRSRPGDSVGGSEQ